MKKIVKRCLLLAFTGTLLAGLPLIAQDGVNGNLVQANWLERNLKNAGVLILEASSAPAQAKQHIPGAVTVSMDAVNIPYGLQELSTAAVEKMYRSLGISYGKKIVIYDQGGAMSATRLFFSLYYHGIPAKDLFILDGGLAKWQEAGLPVTSEVAVPAEGNFTIRKINEDARARLPEVLNASGDTVNNALVEALGGNWHFGEILPLSKAGHIPHGILLPSADFFNPDKTFKSAAEIRRMLAYLGVKPEQQIYSYCGGGIAASVPFFALKFIAGYPKTKLYTASEMGWLADERDLPYWTYDAPYLMRDSNWLQAWSSPMLRMYAGAQVSVVDVRPADAFAQGHVPFALNIPGEVFRSNLASPGRLAEMLGVAGVNSSHEAVIVSGAGLTKASALAFLMLEKLGQKKVSVLMDSMEQWSQRGTPLTKEPTVVGPKKSPMDVAIPPTTYPGNFRPDVVIAEGTNTQGMYAKVFIASGKELPAKAPDGKVVHVPYTDLLNADGRPKAAKDIWNVLSRAGVPRYAELVCISDDPGEAAANYFILKLMGYPDIKVSAL